LGAVALLQRLLSASVPKLKRGVEDDGCAAASSPVPEVICGVPEVISK
jgi:hypothetical protein